MLFKTEKNTDSEKWCADHGFTVDGDRLNDLKDSIMLEDLPSRDEYNKTQVAVMGLAAKDKNIKKKIYKLEQKTIREKAENGFIQYGGYAPLSGNMEELEALADNLDLCYILNFDAKKVTVYIDLKEAKTKAEELEAKAAEETAAAEKAEKDLAETEAELEEAREKAANLTATLKELQGSRTKAMLAVLKANM